MALKAQVTKRRPGSADRRNLLEKLETRQLMAGYSANFNFQPGGPATPAGYTPDYGKQLAWQFGKQYGWNSNNIGQMVDSRTAADNVRDTYAKIGAGGGAHTWEVAVPNGTYSVKITAGDASAYNSRYAFKIEGTTVLDKTPSNGARWAEGTATVIVKDGRLTLQNASGAYNNKINSLSITQTSSSTTGTATGAANEPGDDTISDSISAPSRLELVPKPVMAVGLGWLKVNNASGYVVEESTDGSNFEEVERVDAGTTYIWHDGLEAGQRYYWRVRAFNSSGKSQPTNVVTQQMAGNTSTPTAPSSPSNAYVTAKSSNSAEVRWSNVSGETGYIVEQSTDGWNYSQVGSTNADNTALTVYNLKSGTRYYWRVRARNNAGYSAPSNVASLTTATPTTPTTPTPTTPTSPSDDITNPYALSGISANYSGSASQFTSELNDVGIKNVRVWYSVSSWDAQPSSWYINRAADYKAQGFKVMLCVLTPNVPSYGQAKAFFQRLAAYPGIKNIVDYWQINNEPNMGQFWKGTLKQYVEQNLKPAYEVLKPLGETVVGAGPSWDVNAAKELTKYGYTNYVDYAAFHPYGESGQIVIDRAKGARAAYNNKPMMVTEWNVQFVADKNKWVKEMDIAARGLQHIATINYYFCLIAYSGHVGPGGIMYNTNTKNTLFYDTVKDWMN